jgi:hypothetical protein
MLYNIIIYYIYIYIMSVKKPEIKASKPNTLTKFFTDINDKVLKDNILKSDIKKKITMYSIGFLIIFVILIINTYLEIINKYQEICLINPNFKNNMYFIYIIAILNIILLIIFIASCLILFLNLNVKFVIKNKNFIIYPLALIITIFNMTINSRFIMIHSKCYPELFYKSNLLWINYALTLPICLLILILYFFNNKITK